MMTLLYQFEALTGHFLRTVSLKFIGGGDARKVHDQACEDITHGTFRPVLDAGVYPLYSCRSGSHIRSPRKKNPAVQKDTSIAKSGG
jgi:hypothetical protein